MSEWQECKLGNLLYQMKSVNPKDNPNSIFTYIDVSSICRERCEIIETSEVKGSEAPSRARRLIQTGDVLFATIRPTLKRIAIVPDSLDGEICSTGYFVMKPRESLSNRYLYYFLFTEQFQAEMEQRQKGASYPAVNNTDITDQRIPIPSISEQKRIVAILDEAFGAIARAKENAARNLANARELFDSYLNRVFTEKGDGWENKRLVDLFEIGSSKRILESEWTTSGVPFYGGKEIVKLAKFGSVISNAYISKEKYREYESKYDMPRKGDILITARGTIGVGYVVKEDDMFYYKDGNIISFREKVPMNPHFVLYAFRSNAMLEQFTDLTGTTVRHLPIRKAKELVLNTPSYVLQNKLVKKIGIIENEAKRLESIYTEKLAALDELKQSLLQKAFTGQLTSKSKELELVP